MNRHRIVWAFAIALTAVLAGCGGGQSRSATGRVSLTVVWPERTRLIPQATESVVARLTGPGGYDQPLLFVRATGQSEVTQQWLDLQPGAYTLAGKAHPVADGSGTALASGSAGVQVEPGVTKSVVVTMNSTIDHVTITPADPSVVVGGTLQLTATAYDAVGAVVLTTPGKLDWTTTTGNLLTVNGTGLVTGVAAGSGGVTVTETESGKGASVTVKVEEPSQARYYISVAGAQNYILGASDPWLSSPVYYEPTGAEALAVPLAVAVDGQGRIYIADRNAGQIVRVEDMTGAGRVAFGSWGTGQNQFRNPSDVFVDGQDVIYVADTENGRIVRMDDMSGAGWTEYSTMGWPQGVCTDQNGRIYIADSNRNSIIRIGDMTGADRVELGPVWDAQAVRVGPSGRIYMATMSGLARCDDMQGNGWTEDTGVSPRKIALDSQERILFTSGDGRATRYDSMTDPDPETFDCGGPGLDVWGIAVYEPPVP